MAIMLGKMSSRSGRARSLLVILFAALSTLNASFAWSYGRRSVGTTTAQFLKLGTNARAVAMGEAYAAVTDGSESIYWNPAGLERVNRYSFSFMHAAYLQDIAYDFASYAHRFGELGVLGAGIQYLNAGSIDRTDRVGSNIGTYNPYDLALSFGWARTFKDLALEGEDFIFGITGKYIQSKILETATAGAIDMGLFWSPLTQCNFSFSVQNIGSTMKFKNEDDSLPFNLKLGSSYRPLKGLLLALDVNFPNDNHVYGALGTEYRKSITPNLSLAGRAGLNSRDTDDVPGLSSIAAGFGMGWKAYSLDLSWTPFGRLGNSYLVSISARF